MSDTTYTFALVSATQKHMEIDNVTAVYIPTATGEIGVLGRHEPLVSVVVPGILRIESTTRKSEYAIGSGVLETDGNKLTVIADMVDDGEDTKIKDVEAKKEQAKKIMDEMLEKYGQVDTEEFISAQDEYLKQSALERLAKQGRK